MTSITRKSFLVANSGSLQVVFISITNAGIHKTLMAVLQNAIFQKSLCQKVVTIKNPALLARCRFQSVAFASPPIILTP